MNPADFLAEFRSPSTRSTYKYALNRFFEFKTTTPEQYFVEGKKISDYQHDLIIFARWLEDTRKLSPKCVSTYLGAMVSYFTRNDIELPRKFWKGLQLSSYAIGTDGIITKEILRQILTHTDTCGKAMFLLSSSSGMRIEDVLALTVKQIEEGMKTKPARIQIVQLKTRQKQYVYFSKESCDALHEWIKTRQKYLTTRVNHCINGTYHKKTLDDVRLFPFVYNHVLNLWNKAIEASGYDKKDENSRRHIFHIHTLRKFFRSQCTVAGVEPNIAEMFLGHINGLSQYHQYTEDFIKQQYLKVEDKIRVMVEPVTDEATTHEIATLKTRLDAQSKLIKDLNEGIRNLAMTHSDEEVRKLWEGELAK